MPRIIKPSPVWAEEDRNKTKNWDKVRNKRGLPIVRINCKTYHILERFTSISDAARKLNKRRFADTKNFNMLKSFLSYASLKLKKAYNECYCTEEDIPKYKDMIKKLYRIDVGVPRNGKYFNIKDVYRSYLKRCTATGAEKLNYAIFKRILREFYEWKFQHSILNSKPFKIQRVGYLEPYKTSYKHYSTKNLGGKYHGIEWMRGRKETNGFSKYRNFEPSNWVKEMLNDFRFNELNCKEK